MPEGLTARQAKILDYLVNTLRERGYPPSVREIGAAVGLSSSSTVHAHLAQLEAKGFIKRDPSRSRAIELVDKALYAQPLKEMLNVPLVGRVTAGSPILASQNIEDYFPIPTEFVGTGEFFMLKVRGDSMIQAGILDGDHVIVRKQDAAENGDIVVALVNGDEATVKRLFKEKDHVRLQPENPHMDPIIAVDVRVLGKVVGLVRKVH
ncbi:MAG: transcriptional repressor LexA [Firmicutes bacterium]|nr:transcriptional repressor LexA [Bacillota bacterium]